MVTKDYTKPYVRDKSLNKANNRRIGEPIRPEPSKDLANLDDANIIPDDKQHSQTTLDQTPYLQSHDLKKSKVVEDNKKENEKIVGGPASAKNVSPNTPTADET